MHAQPQRNACWRACCPAARTCDGALVASHRANVALLLCPVSRRLVGRRLCTWRHLVGLAAGWHALQCTRAHGWVSGPELQSSRWLWRRCAASAQQSCCNRRRCICMHEGTTHHSTQPIPAPLHRTPWPQQGRPGGASAPRCSSHRAAPPSRPARGSSGGGMHKAEQCMPVHGSSCHCKLLQLQCTAGKQASGRRPVVPAAHRNGRRVWRLGAAVLQLIPALLQC